MHLKCTLRPARHFLPFFARARSRRGAIGWLFCLGRMARLLLTAAGVPRVWMASNLVGLKNCRVGHIARHFGPQELVGDETPPSGGQTGSRGRSQGTTR